MADEETGAEAEAEAEVCLCQVIKKTKRPENNKPEQITRRNNKRQRERMKTKKKEATLKPTLTGSTATGHVRSPAWLPLNKWHLNYFDYQLTLIDVNI